MTDIGFKDPPPQMYPGTATLRGSCECSIHGSFEPVGFDGEGLPRCGKCERGEICAACGKAASKREGEGFICDECQVG